MKPVWPHTFLTDRCSRWGNTMASSQMRTHTSGRWQRWACVLRCHLAGWSRQHRTPATHRPRLHSGWRDAAAVGLYKSSCRNTLHKQSCCFLSWILLWQQGRQARKDSDSAGPSQHDALTVYRLPPHVVVAGHPSASDSATTCSADAALAQAAKLGRTLVLLHLLRCIPDCCCAALWGPARRQEESGKVQEEHPLDNYFRELIRRRRREMLQRKRAALKSLQVRNSVRSVASLCCGLLPGEAQEIVD